MKNLRIIIVLLISCLCLMTNIESSCAMKNEDEDKNHSVKKKRVKEGIIASSTAFGGFIGSGIGRTATKKFAELLYAKDSNSLLQGSTAIAQIDEFVDNYSYIGKGLCITAGAGACAYLSKKVCDNYPSYLTSWEKLVSRNFDNITMEDYKIYAGNSLGLGFVIWVVYDISR